MNRKNCNLRARIDCCRSWIATQNLAAVNTIAFVLVFAFVYVQGGLSANAKESVFNLPCSRITDRNSISRIKNDRVVITGVCHDSLDLSYLRTNSTLAFIGVTANRINLDNALLGGSLEIKDSSIKSLTAVGAEISYDLSIYSSVVHDKEKRDDDNYDLPDNGCNAFNIPNRVVFDSLNFGAARMRSARLLGLEIRTEMSFRGAHFSGPVSVLLSKATKINMQQLEAESLDLNGCEVSKLIIAQSKIERSLAIGCCHAKEVELWLATVDQTINLQGTTINTLVAFSLECGHLELSSVQPETDFNLDLSFSHLKLLTPILRRSVVYGNFDARGLVVDAFRISIGAEKANELKNFESFVAAGAKTDLTFPVRAAKVLAGAGEFSYADRILRYGSWLNVIRSYVGEAGSLLIVIPIFLILSAWFLLEYSIRQKVAGLSGRSGPNTGLECLLLSIDLFVPNLVALGVQSKHEEYLKKLTWRGTSLLFSYRLFGWVCVSAILLWVSLRWSY